MVEIFTGNGRGKTSAALGVALRALGHGLRVCLVLFMKGNYPYGEQKILSQLPNISIVKFGQETFVDPANIKPEEKAQAKEALEAARKAVSSGEYDLIILDEINVAVAWKLIEVEQVIELIQQLPEKTELILTGRYAHPKLISLADLVTEMVEVKHPYQKGVLSRKGLDY
jgi:cob(I)alamin adenosyltransferase